MSTNLRKRKKGKTLHDAKQRRNHPDKHLRRGQAGHDLFAHRNTRALRRLHPRHRPGQHPPVADAGHPVQDHVGQVGQHHEGAVVQGIGAGRDDPFHPHFGTELRQLGRPAGQEPLHHHPPGSYGHGTPYRRSDARGGTARAEYRRHKAPDGPHPAQRGRPCGQIVHRTFGARVAHRRGAQHDAGGVHEPVGNRPRRLVPERRHLPPQPPPDLLRHGFDADRDRGDRRTGRARRRRRCGARDHGTRHAGRDRLPRKFYRARGPAQGARRLGHGGDSP